MQFLGAITLAYCVKMEIKTSLTLSNYKQLSKNNDAWKKVYISEKPWKEMAIDIDSIVFFHMRKYLDIPYPTRKDEKLVSAAFVHDAEQHNSLPGETQPRSGFRQGRDHHAYP